MVTDNDPAGQGGPAAATAALSRRLRHDMVCALELFTVYLGERLGLYQALAADGPATSGELAARTGTAERYVREWLEHHAASGLLEVDVPAAGPLVRRYRLPPAHLPVLADPDDVRYRGFNGVEIVRAGRGLPQLVEAFRSGGAPPALPWAPEGRADYNRAVFLNLLGTRWLPAIADVDQRLRSEPPARVADLACGTGWSSIAMARAYPLVRVDGLDLDPDVIAAARRNGEQAGLSERVSFAVTDASGPGWSGRYDLVTIFEGLHDMSRPADALRTARGMLRRSGSVIIADELVEDEFTAPASELERYHYGWSVLSCLPAAMGDPRTSATGAVLRPATLRRYAREAGFTSVEVLPLETETWRFYRLTPLFHRAVRTMMSAGRARPGGPRRARGGGLEAVRAAKLAAWGGVAGPLLFTAAWVISSLRQGGHPAAGVQLSGLAAEDARDPQVMMAGFVLLGACSIGFGAALRTVAGRRPAGPWLVVAGGAAAAAAGAFRRDHMLLAGPGFAGESWHNQVHDVASAVAYAAMLTAPLVLARQFRADPRWAMIARPVQALALASAAAMAVFASRAAEPWNGAVQRTAVTLALAAEALVAVRMLTLPSSGVPAAPGRMADGP